MYVMEEMRTIFLVLHIEFQKQIWKMKQFGKFDYA